mmetsp:Transcript_5680/g.7990  ORF Transcript_5680/g.7990 Transcript_5680/m.7990 type:complete len:135 (+) Transcript_5680:1091-1495(+)
MKHMSHSRARSLATQKRMVASKTPCKLTACHRIPQRDIPPLVRTNAPDVVQQVSKHAYGSFPSSCLVPKLAHRVLAQIRLESFPSFILFRTEVHLQYVNDLPSSQQTQEPPRAPRSKHPRCMMGLFSYLRFLLS